jgi:serine protease Do
MSRNLFLSGLVLAIALLAAGASISHGQNVPPPQPTPQVAPHAQPEPEVAPEPPEPPDPPESAEIFLMNDRTAHLGVTLGDVITEKAQELKLPAVAGAIVNWVQKDSAAAKAGIEKGDAIVEFDGVRVRSSAELRRLVRETPAGRTVAIKTVRDGKTRVLSAKLEASSNYFNLNGPEMRLPSINVTPEIHIPPMNFPESFSLFAGHRATLGISGDDLTPQLAQYFAVKQGKGVLVSEVIVGGAADKAGLKAGDVIVQVDGKPVSGVEELRAALNDKFTDDTRKVSLTIVRDRHEQTVNADLTRSQMWEKRTSNAPAQDLAQAMAQLRRAQAEQQRAQADQLRALADQKRALVQAEVLKQKQQVQGEWQRQLQEHMRALKDQLRALAEQKRALHQDKEI